MTRRKRADKSRGPRNPKGEPPRQPDVRPPSAFQDELDRLKQKSRDADAKAIADGKITAEEADRRNSLFPGSLFEIDWKAALSIEVITDEEIAENTVLLEAFSKSDPKKKS